MSRYKITRNVDYVKLIPIGSTLREDLKKLADYLYKLPEDYSHFDMWFLRYNSTTPENTGMCSGMSDIVFTELSCGTVACAAGHAPLAGIDCDEFENYSDLIGYLTNGGDSLVYYWLFATEWSEVDNTPVGAAARIYIALDRGIPTDAKQQAKGEVSACYTAIVGKPDITVYRGVRYAVTAAEDEMELTSFTPPEEVKADLLKLADYLYNLPSYYKHFDMSTFYYTDINALLGSSIILRNPASCNTVACAVGHAPTAGVDCSRFTDYQDLTDWLTNNNRRVYSWLFSGDWSNVDNSHKGAAARIYFLLEQGLPIKPCEYTENGLELPYCVL
jgi:hypothetical protein